jgi:hypothetical protein
MTATREVTERVTAEPASTRGTSWALAAVCMLGSSLALTATFPSLAHWFVIPVTGCGILIGVDAIDWLRRRRDTFDPLGILAVLGGYFFYCAPILNVLLDHWPQYVVPAADWRAALGKMALLNTAGLILYRGVVAFWPMKRSIPGRRDVDLGLLRSWTSVAMAAGVIAYLSVVSRFGGFSGYLQVTADTRLALGGLGWLLLIAESFPLLGFVVVVARYRHWLSRRPALVVALLLVFAATQFLVGGLRGSRSNTVWPILIALGLVHLLVLEIRRRALIVGVLLLGVFMYFYGFYKAGGSDAFDIFTSTRNVSQLSHETGRGLPDLLLGDLGRADMQALVLDRQERGAEARGYGVTYLGDISILVPSAILENRPADKVEIGTQTLYGAGSYNISGFRASRIYGLAGEGMLNFGKPGAVLSFLVLGLFVRFAAGFYDRARRFPAIWRRLVAPHLYVSAMLLLVSDLDNLVWFLLKQTVPTLAVVALSMRLVAIVPQQLQARRGLT